MITKKLTCYAAKDGHSVFCMVGASGTIVRDNIPSHEAINMIEEMHDDIDSLTAERDALKEALKALLLDWQGVDMKQVAHSTRKAVVDARDLLAKLETK